MNDRVVVTYGSGTAAGVLGERATSILFVVLDDRPKSLLPIGAADCMARPCRQTTIFGVRFAGSSQSALFTVCTASRTSSARTVRSSNHTRKSRQRRIATHLGAPLLSPGSETKRQTKRGTSLSRASTPKGVGFLVTAMRISLLHSTASNALESELPHYVEYSRSRLKHAKPALHSIKYSSRNSPVSPHTPPCRVFPPRAECRKTTQ